MENEKNISQKKIIIIAVFVLAIIMGIIYVSYLYTNNDFSDDSSYNINTPILEESAEAPIEEQFPTLEEESLEEYSDIPIEASLLDVSNINVDEEVDNLKKEIDSLRIDLEKEEEL